MCLETYLRCFASKQPTKWHLWLSWAGYWYNTSFYSAIGKTPFEVVYGLAPPSLLPFLPGETSVDSIASVLFDRDKALCQLKVHLHYAQQSMKREADKHCREVSFVEGEWVFVKLRLHRQLTVARYINPKLSTHYFGPFQILSQVREVAYKLKLPKSMKVHPVFHVSQLKKSMTANSNASALPLVRPMEESDSPFPKSVLATHEGKSDGSCTEWLILWKSQLVEEATWESESSTWTRFPSFSLEDKANV